MGAVALIHSLHGQDLQPCINNGALRNNDGAFGNHHRLVFVYEILQNTKYYRVYACLHYHNIRLILTHQLWLHYVVAVVLLVVVVLVVGFFDVVAVSGCMVGCG